MINLGTVIEWLRYRKTVRNRKITQESLLQLNSLTVTLHGRLMLSQMCLDENSDLPYEIKRMYWALLQSAPIQEYAQWN